jgi:outer membrane murein-binding lipoprotein Lpp
MNKSQLADEVYSLRGDIALMKLSALAQQVKFDRLLTAVQQLQEQVDLLNIERDRLEVAKW